MMIFKKALNFGLRYKYIPSDPQICQKWVVDTEKKSSLLFETKNRKKSIPNSTVSHKKGFQLYCKTKMSSVSSPSPCRIFEDMCKKWSSSLFGAEYSKAVTQKNLIFKKVLNLVLRQKCLSSPSLSYIISVTPIK